MAQAVLGRTPLSESGATALGCSRRVKIWRDRVAAKIKLDDGPRHQPYMIGQTLLEETKT